MVGNMSRPSSSRYRLPGICSATWRAAAAGTRPMSFRWITSVGVGADCGGAVDSLLAGLAWRLGRPGEAADRARAGLALETRVGSPVWISRTKDLIARLDRPGKTQAAVEAEDEED
jgi:hypothetical protein